MILLISSVDILKPPKILFFGKFTFACLSLLQLSGAIKAVFFWRNIALFEDAIFDPVKANNRDLDALDDALVVFEGILL